LVREDSVSVVVDFLTCYQILNVDITVKSTALINELGNPGSHVSGRSVNRGCVGPADQGLCQEFISRIGMVHFRTVRAQGVEPEWQQRKSDSQNHDGNCQTADETQNSSAFSHLIHYRYASMGRFIYILHGIGSGGHLFKFRLIRC
jgi:hypothetical protein